MSTLALRLHTPRMASVTWLIGATLACCHDPAHAVADGYFDPTWAGGGHITFTGDLHNPTRPAIAEQITVEANGNLMLGGPVIGTGGIYYWWIGELAPGGAPVQTFGESNGTGLITSCFLSVDLCSNDFSAFALQGDGRITVLGDVRLTRMTIQGHALDTAGVSGGKGWVDVPTLINNVQGSITRGYALAPAAAGKWLVAGIGYYSAAVSNNIDFAVARFNADLSLDPTFHAVTDGNNVTFGGGTVVSFDIGSGNFDEADAVLVRPDGGVVLVGSASSLDVALARLTSNGVLDPTFGGSGTGKRHGPTKYPYSAVTDRAGRILVAASAPLAVARFNADGTPDASFGTQGLSTQTAPCIGEGTATSAAVDSVGRILAVGYCVVDNGGTPATVFLVERLHGDDGSLDPSFGINGFSFGAFETLNDPSYGYAVAFDASGHPIVGGVSGDWRVGVARLTYDLTFSNNFEVEPPGRLPEPIGE